MLKKIVLSIVLVVFLAACGGYKPSNQTWVPNHHKKVNLAKPPQR